MAFKKFGYITFEEPFKVLRSHGLIIKEGTKMSKSKGNVVVPDKYLKSIGADALRMYLMFLGPYQEGGDWRDSGIMGIVRFLNRTWDYFENAQPKESGKELSKWMHASIKKITEDAESLKYNTAISELMMILRKLEQEKSPNSKDLEAFLLLLASFAPFITEELWEKIGNQYSIHKQKWPGYDKDKLISDEVNLVIQVNGKFRGTIIVDKGLSQKEAQTLALSELSTFRTS
jgi:leucyl-tRNA synthetase